MPDKSKLTRRIRRLMALGTQNSNAHEAARAVALAQRLMRRHGLTDDQLAMTGISESVCEHLTSNAEKVPAWMSSLATVVCMATQCRCWFGWYGYVSPGGCARYGGRFTFTASANVPSWPSTSIPSCSAGCGWQPTAICQLTASAGYSGVRFAAAPISSVRAGSPASGRCCSPSVRLTVKIRCCSAGWRSGIPGRAWPPSKRGRLNAVVATCRPARRDGLLAARPNSVKAWRVRRPLSSLRWEKRTMINILLWCACLSGWLCDVVMAASQVATGGGL